MTTLELEGLRNICGGEVKRVDPCPSCGHPLAEHEVDDEETGYLLVLCPSRSPHLTPNNARVPGPASPLNR